MKVTPKRLARAAAQAQGTSTATAGMSKQRDLAARHEAAHAVVAVRLGFSLTALHIQQRVLHGADGAVALSNGFTAVDISSLAHLGPTELLLRRMLCAAAPIIVEHARGAGDTEVVCADDVRGVHECIDALDLPEPHACDLFEWAMYAAAHVLMQDDGDAWRLVTGELRRRRFLTPARVVRLITDSDARRALHQARRRMS